MTGETDLWELLETFGRGEMAECAHALARLVVTRARGERAFVMALDARDDRVWGTDLDGLPIAEPGKRIDRESLAKARRADGLAYEPDVARLVVCGARSAVVVEHRFAKAAFDGVSRDDAKRWATLADLVARMGEAHGAGGAGATKAAVPRAEESSSVLQAGMSTAMPRREVTREYPEILGRSASLRRALAALDAAVDTDLPVLVRGETGTGKELFARALHDHGARSAGPFVAVNCAAIADALFEAELFGHARGAFTGADRARGGLLARAEGGTLLLDEIGELSPMRQATLLRVLESKRYRAVGTDDERSFDVRIVAATNRDLDAAVDDGTFRKDLLYRLRVLEVIVPPLRERLGDVAILFRHFLARAGSRATIAPAALEALAAYPFPGNVRELLHQAQRLAASGVVRVEIAHLPRTVRNALAEAPPGSDGEAERAEVERALARTGGNISQAAGLLGITRHGLKKRMLRLGLRAKGTAS
jgi:transcriptional regulator with PAS, ATPase and Fis domain